MNNITCPFTGETKARRVFVYSQPPPREIQFQEEKPDTYHREIWQFDLSRHYISIHQMELPDLYTGAYVDSNYRDVGGLRESFKKIIALPSHRSDNAGRIEQINSFVQERSYKHLPYTLLDVGSGLGVFPFGMKEAGWTCTAVDPDSRSIRHIQGLGIQARHTNFMDLPKDDRYSLITFNKVLEHVPNPTEMLRKGRCHLIHGGLVYIEVPDGEMAELEGANREEFFIDHQHVFSFTSVAMMADQAGFSTLQMQRLQEPSGKYTIRAFLAKIN